MNDPVWDAECDLIGEEAANLIAQNSNPMPVCDHVWVDVRNNIDYVFIGIYFVCKKCKRPVSMMDFKLMDKKEKEKFSK